MAQSRRVDGVPVIEAAAHIGVSRTCLDFGFRSPERFTELATVGTKLPLRVDPADPRSVTIDLPAPGITPG